MESKRDKHVDKSGSVARKYNKTMCSLELANA